LVSSQIKLKAGIYCIFANIFIYIDHYYSKDKIWVRLLAFKAAFVNISVISRLRRLMRDEYYCTLMI